MPEAERAIRVERRPDGVVELVIDRPPVNAFSVGLLHELAALLAGVGAEPETRAVLLRADGRGFCAGGDVKEAEALEEFGGILGQASGSLAASLSLIHCPVPVICAVHAYCVGVGVLVSGCADVLVAAEGTRFVLAEIDNGATAGGVMALRLMPEKRVRAAMMTAEPVMAEELHRYGAIYSLASPLKLTETARALADAIAAKDPASMRRLKQSLHHSTRAAEIESAYRAELSYTYELNMLGRASEGRAAFFSGARKTYLA